MGGWRSISYDLAHFDMQANCAKAAVRHAGRRTGMRLFMRYINDFITTERRALAELIETAAGRA